MASIKNRLDRKLRKDLFYAHLKGFSHKGGLKRAYCFWMLPNLVEISTKSGVFLLLLPPSTFNAMCVDRIFCQRSLKFFRRSLHQNLEGVSKIGSTKSWFRTRSWLSLKEIIISLDLEKPYQFSFVWKFHIFDNFQHFSNFTIFITLF